MTYRTAVLCGMASLLASPALAGSIAPPPLEPVVAAPAPHTAPAPDWTGFYIGAGIGWVDIDTNIPGIGGDGLVGGLTIGYDHDFGSWVIGGALDYDWADVTLFPGISVESEFRAKLRGGFKMGNGLIYATGGYALADTNLLGDDDGYFIGAGYDHLIGERFSLGTEVLWHQFDGVNGTPVDAEGLSIHARGTFRF